MHLLDRTACRERAGQAQRVAALLGELDELTAIVSASRKTARSRINRHSTIDNRQLGGPKTP